MSDQPNRRWQWSMPSGLGVLFLAIFLLLYGLQAVTNFEVVWMGPLTGLCALIAGILLLFGR